MQMFHTNFRVDPRLATALINEFPCRPHWTKNTREVFGNATKNIDPSVRLLGNSHIILKLH